MSMHLRGSRDMMGNNEEGWWKSRTGMEQKLLILCTILFIVVFSLTIALIVAKNKTKPNCDVTTIAPIPTDETITSTESPPETTVSEEISTASETEPSTSPSTETTSEEPGTISTEAISETTETTPEEEKGPIHVTAKIGA